MVITNKTGLPDNIVKAITFSAHRKADYSITELIDPVRITLLKKRYWDKIEQDASELIWALLGKSIHYILEKSEQAHQLVEERLTEKVFNKTISGTSDLYDNEELIDYKITSTWSIIFETKNKKWEEQLNCYAWLFRKAGFDVKKLKVIAILRDWSKTQAERSQDYPDTQIKIIEIPLWTFDTQQKFIEEKVQELIINEQTPDEALPLCSKEDKWQKDDTWAVMSEGRQKAIRVFDTEAEAQKYLDDNNVRNGYIVHRPGEAIRCQYYCLVKNFCNQYRKEVKNE